MGVKVGLPPKKIEGVRSPLHSTQQQPLPVNQPDRHTAKAGVCELPLSVFSRLCDLDAGTAALRQLREDQLRKYLLILDACAVDRLPRVNPGLLNLARTQQPA